MANLRLKKHILEVVENQLRANDPPFVKEVYQQLQAEGIPKKQCKEMIAAVLLGEIYEVMKFNRPFNEEHYKEELYGLVHYEDDWDELEEDEILSAKWRVYDAMSEQRPTQATKIFLTVWDDIKTFVKENCYKTDNKGNIIKPELIDVDEQTDYKYEFYNWIGDMEITFMNSRMYEEAITYFSELIDLFAWEEESCDYYKANIGEVYNAMEKYEECDKYFEDWLKQEPNNIPCISIYILCVMLRDDDARAKKMIEQYVSLDMNIDDENEILFERAAEVYYQAGDEQKAEQYEEKIKRFHKNKDKYTFSALPFYNDNSVIKGKKIYPNEPCPCGSGKKYKKCCGKNT